LRELVELIAARRERPTIVGITGPVAVGKTTIAAELAELLRIEHALRVATLTTDGFLLPNAELETRGLSMRKGFPESFDSARLNAFLGDARDLEGAPLRVPLYDHLTYDVVSDRELDVDRGDVLIVEGVNTLAPEHFDAYDITVYVDAPDEVVVEWFCARLLELFREAVDDPSSFYAPFAGMSDDQIREFSLGAWDSINAVNLERHIRPTRRRADVVIEKAPDHTVRRVIIR
jgi:type I pantothenate kinase